MQLGGACGRARAAVPEAVPDGGSSPPPALYPLVQAASLWRDCVRSRHEANPVPRAINAGVRSSAPPKNNLSAVARRPRAPSGVRRGLFHHKETNHAIRHSDRLDSSRGRRVRAADGAGVERQENPRRVNAGKGTRDCLTPSAAHVIRAENKPSGCRKRPSISDWPAVRGLPSGHVTGPPRGGHNVASVQDGIFDFRDGAGAPFHQQPERNRQ